MASRPCVVCRSPARRGRVCDDCRDESRSASADVTKATADRGESERSATVPRYSRRRHGGWSETRAERFFGGPVVPAILLPWRPWADAIQPERRATERTIDRSIPVWVTVGRDVLLDLFPHGSRVAGPFVTLGDGEYDEGRGVVDWASAEVWAVPDIGIPVKVTSGDRGSGGYLPIELRTIEREVAEIDPYEDVEQRIEGAVDALDELSDEFTALPRV